MRKKLDADGVQLRDGDQVVLLYDEGTGAAEQVLLLEITDLQQGTPMIEVQVVALLEHRDAKLFVVGEKFEAMPHHLSRREATLRRPA
jgi:uncharacterized Zn ribbon protein